MVAGQDGEVTQGLRIPNNPRPFYEKMRNPYPTPVHRRDAPCACVLGGVGPGLVAGRDGEVTQGLRVPNNPPSVLQKMRNPYPTPVHSRDAPCVRPGGVGPGMVAGQDGEVTQGLRIPNNPVRFTKKCMTHNHPPSIVGTPLVCVLWRGGGVGRGVGPGMVAGRDGEVTQGLRVPNNPRPFHEKNAQPIPNARP